MHFLAALRSAAAWDRLICRALNAATTNKISLGSSGSNDPSTPSDTPELLRERTPILLSDQLDALAKCRVLLNFEPGVPPGIERFERVLELVSTDAEQVAAGRARFKAYKALGLTLNHHVMSA